MTRHSKENKLGIPQIKDIVYQNKDLDYIDKYCSYTQKGLFDKFVGNTLYYYKDSRELFGDLFDFSAPFSSFQSPFIALGIVSTR